MHLQNTITRTKSTLADTNVSYGCLVRFLHYFVKQPTAFFARRYARQMQHKKTNHISQTKNILNPKHFISILLILPSFEKLCIIDFVTSHKCITQEKHYIKLCTFLIQQ